jgi:hypothetical protein
MFQEFAALSSDDGSAISRADFPLLLKNLIFKSNATLLDGATEILTPPPPPPQNQKGNADWSA